VATDTPNPEPRTEETNDQRAEHRRRREFFANAPLQAAEALRKALPMSEDHYRGSVGYNQMNARAYFLYGCMDEVFKASMASMRWAEAMDMPEEELRTFEASPDAAERHMSRVLLESVIDEQAMWGRKLSELLVDLILFEASNEEDYYRIYLGCRWLVAYLGLQNDFEEFFASRSCNAASTITQVTREIEEDRSVSTPRNSGSYQRLSTRQNCRRQADSSRLTESVTSVPSK